MQRVSSARLRRGSGRLRVVMLAAAALFVLALPTTGSAIVKIDDENNDQLADFDVRDAATVAPTAAQKTAAQGLAARVTWNSYGTPGTIFNENGWVARGIKAPSAAAAARVWLNGHKGLFRIDSGSAGL